MKTFIYEHLETQEEVREHIKECEGRHTQQAIYSTFHDALTQVCFGYRWITDALNRFSTAYQIIYLCYNNNMLYNDLIIDSKLKLIEKLQEEIKLNKKLSQKSINFIDFFYAHQYLDFYEALRNFERMK